MEVKELFLSNDITVNPDESYSAVPFDFDSYHAMLPFWLPAKIFCILAFGTTFTNKIDITLRILGPDGKDCGFMRKDQRSTFFPFKCSIEVPLGTNELPFIIDTHGPTFSSYGEHSILLVVNDELLSTIPFLINNPQEISS